MIATLIKSALWPIVWNLIKESLLAIFRKLKWQILIERFICRVISNGLRWLAKTDSNGLTGKTAEDALAMIQRDDLPELK